MSSRRALFNISLELFRWQRTCEVSPACWVQGRIVDTPHGCANWFVQYLLVVVHCIVDANCFPRITVKLSLGGIDCDINVNDQLGCINSYMIAHYCELVPLLRPLVFAIKQWARSHGFNNPSGNGGAVTFSSYCLTLMTIGFLQSKGLAPNLQAGLEWNERMLTRNEAHESVFWLRSQTSNERTPCYYGYHLLSSWTPDLDAPTPSVGELLLDWFRCETFGAQLVLADLRLDPDSGVSIIITLTTLCQYGKAE